MLTGSLSAAAERLGVPLPTMSRRIRELERERFSPPDAATGPSSRLCCA